MTITCFTLIQADRNETPTAQLAVNVLILFRYVSRCEESSQLTKEFPQTAKAFTNLGSTSDSVQNTKIGYGRVSMVQSHILGDKVSRLVA
jgi:hypothetical protein